MAAGVTRRLAFAALFTAVLLGGFFYAAVTTLTDDPNLDW